MPALLQISLIFLLGVVGQVAAYITRLPSILYLLFFGILAGPVLELLHPTELFGGVLPSIVSISVALILFEGGLSLKFNELPAIKSTVVALITAGGLISLALTATIAHFLVGLSWEVASLLGAITIVSGPTVVVPMLRFIRAQPPLGTILRWEGILIDPIGVLLATLVLEIVLFDYGYTAPLHIIFELAETAGLGLVLGAASGFVILTLIERFLIPDTLHNPLTLCAVICTYAISEILQQESGLWTATVMGIYIANYSRHNHHQLIEFHENLRDLIISSLFIVLAAKTTPEELASINGPVILLGIVMILAVRPLVVLISCAFTDLSFRQKLFLGGVAPRGIVAASLASVAGLELHHYNVPGAHYLAPYTMFLIILTVATYGVGSKFLAQALGLRLREPQGILMMGGHVLARALARRVLSHGFRVIIVDTNGRNVRKARRFGIEAFEGNILSEELQEHLDLEGIGKFFALTANDEANSLAALHFQREFGKACCYQVRPAPIPEGKHKRSKEFEPTARSLFSAELTSNRLALMANPAEEIVETSIETEQKLKDWRESNPQLNPVFLFPGKGDLHILIETSNPSLAQGDVIVSLKSSSPAEFSQNQAHLY